MYTYEQEPSWQREHIIRKNVSGDPLAVIYNEGLWRLHKASPLNNLQYDSVKLKQYASKVRQALVSEVSANVSVRYTVLFEIQPALKYCLEDPDALKLTVKSNSEANKNHSTEIYTAFFLSWGIGNSNVNAVSLPYMLEKGDKKLSLIIKSAVQKIFDCIINRFCLTQHQLLYFGFNFLDYGASQDKDPFILVYESPQISMKDKVVITFEVGDVGIIWNGIKEEISQTTEQVLWSYKMLRDQLLHGLKFDISAFNLCEISLPKAQIKYNGTVKMKTPEIVNCVFKLLNDISNELQVNSDVSSVGSNGSSVK